MISIRIKDTGDLKTLKEEIKKRVRGQLFQGSYFVIENAEELPQEKLKDLEEFLRELSLESIKRVGSSGRKRSERKERLLIVDGPIRSGQKIEHGGDVLVLGDVNKDAQIVAVGNIVVMGVLRGIAIAGALGDESAVVVALRMEPQQIRIGKKIAISDDPERVSPGYPEVAKVEDGMIVLEKV